MCSSVGALLEPLTTGSCRILSRQMMNRPLQGGKVSDGPNTAVLPVCTDHGKGPSAGWWEWDCDSWSVKACICCYRHPDLSSNLSKRMVAWQLPESIHMNNRLSS